VVIITWMILRDRRKRRIIELNQPRPPPPGEPNYGRPEPASKSITQVVAKPVTRRPVPLSQPNRPPSPVSPILAESVISSPPVYAQENPEMDGRPRPPPEMQGVPDVRPGYFEVHG
jgi:hypothetical protein